MTFAGCQLPDLRHVLPCRIVSLAGVDVHGRRQARVGRSSYHQHAAERGQPEPRRSSRSGHGDGNVDDLTRLVSVAFCFVQKSNRIWLLPQLNHPVCSKQRASGVNIVKLPQGIIHAVSMFANIYLNGILQ